MRLTKFGVISALSICLLTVACSSKKKASEPSKPSLTQTPAEAQKSDSGLASMVLKPGTGTVHPEAEDTVSVYYSGWTADGHLFDSSAAHGVPVTLSLARVIRGWNEGVQLMVVGEKRRFWIPQQLAYGDRPPPGAPAGPLTFDIELLGITQGPKPIPAPDDVAKPPRAARHGANGLRYMVLKRGEGHRHPKATDTVEVHYTGWTTDGRMFDSSLRAGHTVSFPLNQVIPGWTRGLQLMTEGEKARFWIPKELAYNDQPGRPRGMLVFDIELVSIR